MKIRSIIAGLVVTAFYIVGSPVIAQDWKPSSDLRLQIAFGAGGSTDTVGRVLAKVVEQQTGWNVVVENKSGGGGIAMFTGISKMPATGHVVGMGVNMPILVNLVKRGAELGFDLDSFDYIGTVTPSELALVASADAPFDDLKEMIAHAKVNGAIPVSFGAPPQKLLMDVATRTTGANFNMVSTKGGAETMKLILGGHVMAGFSSGEHFQYVESGDMKVIASAGRSRLSYDADAATFREIGIEAYVDPYVYLATTAGTDPAALAALRSAFDAAVNSREVAEIVKNAINNTPKNLGSAETRKMLVDGIGNVKILFGK